MIKASSSGDDASREEVPEAAGCHSSNRVACAGEGSVDKCTMEVVCDGGGEGAVDQVLHGLVYAFVEEVVAEVAHALGGAALHATVADVKGVRER